MDSSGIGVLLGRYKQMRASGGAVTYYGAGAQVARILTVGGMAKLIRGFEDKESAINGCSLRQLKRLALSWSASNLFAVAHPLRIYIDSEDGINVDDCADVSHQDIP